jgi:F-type H+-transporting ATPase subunit b
MTSRWRSIAPTVVLFAAIGGIVGTACSTVAYASTPAVSAEEHGAKESPIDLKLDLGLWSLLVFVGLLLVLRRFAWGPLMEGLDAREKHINGEIAEAERANAEAQRLLAEHGRKLAEVQNEVRVIIDEARRDAQNMQQQLLKQAQDEAQATRDRALRDIELAKDRALRDIFERAADVATEAAAQIVRRTLTPQDHRDLVAQVIKELPSRN